jgi:trigger factor
VDKYLHKKNSQYLHKFVDSQYFYMKVEKKDLDKSQIELIVELSVAEFEPYIKKGTEKVSQEVKIEGFRPGKVPYEVLKGKIGEMTIMEEAARIAINKTVETAIKEHIDSQPVGQPQIDIIKLAPNNPLEYKVVVAVLPEVTLGDYKNVKVKLKKVEIKDEEVEKTIKDLQEMRAQESIVDREVKDKDKVIVDMQMFADKVPIEGGQGKDTAVIIGRDYIIPGFDKKLIGTKKGETREFSLPYPANYHMKNLAGKMELDDNFALGFGLKKLPELKDNIKRSLLDQKENENKQIAEREMLEKIISSSRFGDIPELLIDHEAKTMMAELEQSIANQGGKFEDYLSSLNKTREQLILDLLPEAVKRVKVSLLIREVARVEKIKVEDNEMEKHIKELREYYRSVSSTPPPAGDILDKINTPEYKNYVLNVLTSRKVIDKLSEWNIEK